MNEIPKNPFMRYWMNSKGQVFVSHREPGERLLGYFALMVPTAEQTRASLLRLRTEWRLSRAQLAVSLGIGKDTLRRWETGERNPSTAARKLVRLTELLFFSQEQIGMEFGGSIMGHFHLGILANATPESVPKKFRAKVEEMQRVIGQKQNHEVKERATDGNVPEMPGNKSPV